MSEGDGTLEDFLSGQVKFTSELVEAATTANFADAENIFKCPRCGSALTKRNGKNGEFWGCTNYPKCRTTFDDKNGKPDFDGKKFLLAEKFSTPIDYNPADFEPILSSANFKR